MKKINSVNENPFDEEDRPSGWYWWPLSVAVHLLLLLALGLWAGEEVSSRRESLSREPELLLEASRAEALSEMAETLNRDEMLMHVRALEEAQLEMRSLRDEKIEAYRAVENLLVSEAPDTAAAQLATALEAQQDALAAQADADQRPLTTEIMDAQNRALSHQTDAAAALHAASLALGLTGESVSEVLQQVDAARQKQTEADEAQVEAAGHAKDIRAVEVHDQGRNGDLERRQRELDYQEGQHHGALEKLEQAQARVSALEQTLVEKQQAEDEKTRAVASLRTREAERDQLRSAEREAKQAADARVAAERNLRGARESLSRAEREEKTQGGRAERKRTEVAASQKKVDAAEARKAQLREEMKEAQARALAAQTEAAARTQAAAETLARLAAADALVRETPPELDLTPIPDTRVPADAPLADMYREAVTLEDGINQIYRELRAAELARITRIPFTEAKRQTEALQVDRPDLADPLDGVDVRSAGALAEQRKAIETALRESQSMTLRAELLLSGARGMSEQAREHGSSVHTGGFATAVMQRGNPNVPPQEVQDVTAAMEAYYGGEYLNQRRADNLQPPALPKNFKPFPDRRVVSHGIPASWMAVQSWYIVGPFDNPARKHANTSFPPESAIDLDATYQGKYGEPIRWEYVQSGGVDGKILVNPPGVERGVPESVYYATTELYFKEALETWVAMGFDDKGTLWINGFPVWESGVGNYNWSPNQKFRRVLFKQGVNRVLYRVENGWGWCAFSLYVHLGGTEGL
ncbi:MAG: hypothetical protein WD490_06120 [Opitutales bacterium]